MFGSFSKTLSTKNVKKRLAQVVEPVLAQPLSDLDAIRLVEVADGHVNIGLSLGYVSKESEHQLKQSIQQCLADLEGITQLNIQITAEVLPKPGDKPETLQQVKNVIAVASGKGGVGKSTTAVNLALALAAEGAVVGLLDADIYGPSQPQMLGVGQKAPKIIDNRWMVPIEAHGIKSISMGYMVNEKTPMVWRGPMVSGAFQQLVNQTQWGELDYLVIDMPPGTGDIQLTLSQSVPVAGAVIVTTPQDIALLDAKKGIEMFRKVNVPVLGVVENMATHICSQCGHEEHIFGEGGGEKIAKQFDTQLLGALPLALNIREQTDAGNPTVVAEPDSPVTKTYRDIARRVGANMWQVNRKAQAPVFEQSDT